MKTAAARIAFCLVLAGATPAVAQEFPDLRGPVTDTAQVIDAASAETLATTLGALRKDTGAVVAIVTVPTIAPAASISEYAVRLFEHAGVGNKDLDNGVLIVVAVKEHGVRIEVGYGLEGAITDGFAGDVIRTSFIPAFRENRYGDGLVAGTARIVERLRNPGATPVAGDEPAAHFPWIGFLAVLGMTGALIGLIVFAARRASPGRSQWTPAAGAAAASNDDDTRRWTSSDDSSSSSSSSDSGGFDGGHSGGGGAEGSW
jgi:uncharacterized protein